MKLRFLVLLLALANIALFAWGWTHADVLRAPAAAASLQRQIRPDALQIEPPAPPVDVAPAAPSRPA